MIFFLYFPFFSLSILRSDDENLQNAREVEVGVFARPIRQRIFQTKEEKKLNAGSENMT